MCLLGQKGNFKCIFCLGYDDLICVVMNPFLVVCKFVCDAITYLLVLAF